MHLNRSESVGAFYHGGVRGLKVGDRILPPKNTGAPSCADYGAATVCRRDRVYLVKDEDSARMFALLYAPRGRGWVYECDPLGDIEPDSDYLGPSGDSIQCPAARVVRIVARDVAEWHGLSMAQCLAVLA